jgi:hypothetical protein
MPEGEQVNETSAFIFRIGMTANQWVKVAERRAVVPPVLKDSSLYDQPLTVEWPALLPVTHAEEPLYPILQLLAKISIFIIDKYTLHNIIINGIILNSNHYRLS